MKALISLILLALLHAIPAAAQDADAILKRGHLLYQHDQAAWHGTDRFMATVPRGFDMSTLRGYVVTSDAPDNGVVTAQVSFFVDTPDGFRVVWDGTVRNAKTMTEDWLAAPRPLTPRETAKRTAIQTAIPAITETCGRQMNTAVLDGVETGRDDLLVYFLTPMQSMNEAVFGRHYRAHVSPDGETLLGSHSFTNSCAIFPTKTDEGDVVMITTSHLRDDFPQETHVFVSLMHKLDIAVGISKLNKNYIVNGDAIRRIDPE